MIFAKVRVTEMGLVIQGTYNKFLNFLNEYLSYSKYLVGFEYDLFTILLYFFSSECSEKGKIISPNR